MKAIKIFGLIILAIIGLLFVIPAYLPTEVTSSETVFLKSDPVTIFKAINRPENWMKWSAWFESDPELSVYYCGPKEGVGAEMHWKGPVSGEGKVKIVKSVPYKKIQYQLYFYENILTRGIFLIHPKENGTELEWQMKLDSLSYPFERWKGAILPLTIKTDFRQGLNQMKTFLSK